MASAVEYTTIQQQIEALQGKGLLFDSKERAKLVLERYGYYNIINSYKEPYQNVIENQRKYIAGTTFEQIYSMFTLDHNLRNSIMAAMLELEECLRAATAEVIAVSFGVDHNDYLKFRNYRDRYSSNPKFSLDSILGKLRNNVGSDKDPIKYYREKYHVVPPWILFKGTYFSTLINLIKYLKKAEKQHLIRIVLRIPDDAEITEEITTLFQTILFICLDYRNAAAHGGRIYNFQSPHVRDVRISEETIRCFPTLANAEVSAGIRLLLILLSVFKNRQSGNIIHNSLEEQLNRHLGRYPNDLDILSGCIGIAIQSAKYVWVNEKTKIYHSNDFCSGMTDGIKRKLEDVDTSIYYPCKRCIQERNNQ